MGSITIHETVGAPVETVFAYVDDHKHTTKYMQGLSKWKPTGATTHGKGAQFEVAMKAGPTTLGSVVDITTWTENRAIGWTSVEGFKQKGQWSFTRKGDQTAVTFTMTYELPGGIAGRMLSRAADPIVRGNLQKSVQALKQQVEKLKPAQAAKTSATGPAKTSARTSGARSATSSAKTTAKAGARKSTDAPRAAGAKSAGSAKKSPPARAKSSKSAKR
jgi:uncharacterized membrane protein